MFALQFWENNGWISYTVLYYYNRIIFAIEGWAQNKNLENQYW